jgi:hypothetical protein
VHLGYLPSRHARISTHIPRDRVWKAGLVKRLGGGVSI